MQHILFTDVDRTLLTHTYKVLPEVERAFDLAKDAGLKIVFVTARAPDSLLPIASTLRNLGVCCCFGGGWVGDLISYEAAEVHRLPIDVATDVMAEATKSGAFPVWYDVRTVYAPVINDIVECQLGNVGESAVLLEGTKAIPLPLKIMLIDKREEASLSALANAFTDRATVSFSHRHLLEVGPKQVNKGSGLKSVVAKFSDGAVITHAVGDAQNDIPLLAAADHRYTVGNGLGELKKMVEFVGGSCDEGGLADVINHIISRHM